MNEALASGHTWKGQTFGGRKNGDSYPQDVRIIPVFAPSGRIIHHVGIKRDLSKQVEAHDNLRQVAKSIAEVQEVVQHHYIEPSRYSQRNGQCCKYEVCNAAVNHVVYIVQYIPCLPAHLPAYFYKFHVIFIVSIVSVDNNIFF
jgi:hypothetical protein